MKRRSKTEQLQDDSIGSKHSNSKNAMDSLLIRTYVDEQSYVDKQESHIVINKGEQITVTQCLDSGNKEQMDLSVCDSSTNTQISDVQNPEEMQITEGLIQVMKKQKRSDDTIQPTGAGCPGHKKATLRSNMYFVPNEMEMARLKLRWCPDTSSSDDRTSNVSLDEKDVVWNIKCDAVEEYGRQFGTCNVPLHVKIKNLKTGSMLTLGSWLQHQRDSKMKGKLSAERTARLERLATDGKFSWMEEPTSSTSSVMDIDGQLQPGQTGGSSKSTRRYLSLPDPEHWEYMFQALIQYGKNHNGDCNVPSNYVRVIKDNLTSSTSGRSSHGVDSTFTSDKPDKAATATMSIHPSMTSSRNSTSDTASNTATVGITATEASAGNLSVDKEQSTLSSGLEEASRTTTITTTTVTTVTATSNTATVLIPKPALTTAVIGTDSSLRPLQTTEEVVKDAIQGANVHETAVKLGYWLRTQRQYKRRGVYTNLWTVEREGRLQELVDQGKLAWDLDQSDDAKWDSMLAALVEYGATHNGGNCMVSQNFVYTLSDGTQVRLGEWLKRQRCLKKGQIRGNCLREDREARLQELVDQGKLAWLLEGNQSDKDNDKWDLMYNALLEYGAENKGDCNAAQSVTCLLPDGSTGRLGGWLKNQRDHRKGQGGRTLRPDREQRLEELVSQGRLKWEVKDR